MATITVLDHLLVRVNVGDVAILNDGRAILTEFHRHRADKVVADVTDLCNEAAALGLIRPDVFDRPKWSLAPGGAMRLASAQFIDPMDAGVALVEWGVNR